MDDNSPYSFYPLIRPHKFNKFLNSHIELKSALKSINY